MNADRELARDMADLPPVERDEDGEPVGPWSRIDCAASDAAIAEAARRIEARTAQPVAVAA